MEKLFSRLRQGIFWPTSPDRPFQNSRASQSGDCPILFTSATSFDWFESSKHVIGSVGLRCLINLIEREPVGLKFLNYIKLVVVDLLIPRLIIWERAGRESKQSACFSVLSIAGSSHGQTSPQNMLPPPYCPELRRVDSPLNLQDIYCWRTASIIILRYI